MDNYDAAKATRVWQRVQGAKPAVPEADGIPALIAGELEDSATYLYLAKRMGQKESQILRRLAEEEQSHGSCLKGIYRLMTGEQSSPVIPPVRQQPAEQILRRCYGKEMRCLAQYEARSADPEYGPVFARLAAQEREHCMTVLELIGRLNGLHRSGKARSE